MPNEPERDPDGADGQSCDPDVRHSRGRLRAGVLVGVVVLVLVLAGGTALAVKLDVVLPDLGSSSSSGPTSTTQPEPSAPEPTATTAPTGREDGTTTPSFHPGPGTTLLVQPTIPPKGPFTVPDMVRTDAATTLAMLRSSAERFTLTPGWGNSCLAPDVYVTEQKPAPGTVVTDPSTHVVIWCDNQPVSLPRITGRTIGGYYEMHLAYYNLHLDPSCYVGGSPSEPTMTAMIVRQEPAAGSRFFPQLDDLHLYCQ